MNRELPRLGTQDPQHPWGDVPGTGASPAPSREEEQQPWRGEGAPAPPEPQHRAHTGLRTTVQPLLPRNSVNAGSVAVVMLRRQSWKSQSLHLPRVSLSPAGSRLGTWGKRPEPRADGTGAGEREAMALWHLTQAAGHGSQHSPPFQRLNRKIPHLLPRNWIEKSHTSFPEIG